MMKKASVHLEIVLSFVIFSGFIIFLFAVFNPFRTNDNNNLYFEIAKLNIEKNTSSELRFFTVITNATPTKCVYFTTTGLNNISARNSKREKLEAEFTLNELRFRPTENITYFYSSEDFSQNIPTTNCNNLLAKGEFSVGIVMAYNLTSFKKFSDLKEFYLNNYDKVKEMLGLPKNKDIAIYLKEDNNVLIGADIGYIRSSIVNSKNYPVQIAYASGDIKYGMLNIQIW